MAGDKERVVIKAHNRDVAQEDSLAEGIIKGLHDFKEGRFTRLRTP